MKNYWLDKDKEEFVCQVADKINRIELSILNSQGANLLTPNINITEMEFGGYVVRYYLGPFAVGSLSSGTSVNVELLQEYHDAIRAEGKKGNCVLFPEINFAEMISQRTIQANYYFASDKWLTQCEQHEGNK